MAAPAIAAAQEHPSRPGHEGPAARLGAFAGAVAAHRARELGGGVVYQHRGSQADRGPELRGNCEVDVVCGGGGGWEEPCRGIDEWHEVRQTFGSGWTI